jgi:hypothetical protein
MEYPFEEKLGEYDKVIRIFDETISEDDLVWHRDAEDRLLRIVGERSDWKIQLENSLPQDIDGTFIPKETYHRLIKGTGKVVLDIKKYVDI